MSISFRESTSLLASQNVLPYTVEVIEYLERGGILAYMIIFSCVFISWRKGLDAEDPLF
jgi:hypothetical protein